MADDILSVAAKRFNHAWTADEANRGFGLDDLEFLAGEQWPGDVKKARESDGRPVLTINQMPRFLRQVTGDIRRTNPAISIVAADSEASEDVADIIGGLIRHIEFRSDATSIYEGSAELAAACGIGNFRILSQYEDDSFDQELLVKRIHNPFSVYWDPDARDPTRSDARYCFVTEWMDRKEFDEKYPGKAASDLGADDATRHWTDGDRVQVAEYFRKEPVKRKIGMLANGEIVRNPRMGMDIVQMREVDAHEVRWMKITASDVLEDEITLPGSHIPVVSVVGEEIHIGERIIRTGVIRYAKDPQRMYNYWRSAQTEVVALQPKAPYLVTAKQIAGLETFWNEANKANRPYLPYNADPAAGRPERSTPPMSSSGMMQEIALAAEDMKATTGIHDAALGERSNETSGVAIKQRQLESDISTSVYVDNLSKSIAQCGRILVDWIPKYYDTARTVRIIGRDDVEDLVEINQIAIAAGNIQIPMNMLSIGKYSVRVTTGPSYTTQRQESAESMLAFIKAFPQMAPAVMDLVAKNMDWPGADQFAERFKKMVPDGLLEEQEDLTPEQAQAAEAQRVQAQQQQALQELVQQMELRQMDAQTQKAEAEADEADSDADKAHWEALRVQLELAGLGPKNVAARAARVPLGARTPYAGPI